MSERDLIDEEFFNSDEFGDLRKPDHFYGLVVILMVLIFLPLLYMGCQFIILIADNYPPLILILLVIGYPASLYGASLIIDTWHKLRSQIHQLWYRSKHKRNLAETLDIAESKCEILINHITKNYNSINHLLEDSFDSVEEFKLSYSIELERIKQLEKIWTNAKGVLSKHYNIYYPLRSKLKYLNKDKLGRKYRIKIGELQRKEKNEFKIDKFNLSNGEHKKTILKNKRKWQERKKATEERKTSERITKSRDRNNIVSANTDWLEINEKRKRIGDIGEVLALEYENKRLALKPNLVSQIIHISQTEGDGHGYDIKSFNVNGSDRFIEVKSTTSKQIQTFFLTSNELNVLKSNPKSYYIYLIYNIDITKKSSVIKEISGYDLLHNYHFEPKDFKAIKKDIS